MITSITFIVFLFLIGIFGLCKYKQLSSPFRVLTISVIVAFILAIFSLIFSVKYGHNAPIIQLECITEFIFFLLTFYHLFIKKGIKKFIVCCIIIGTLLFLLNTLFLQRFNESFPTFFYLISHLLFVVFSLFLFKQMLSYPLSINISKQSAFWFNTAILFYSTTMFLNLGLTNYYDDHNIVTYVIFYFWYVVLFIFYSLIGVSILLEKKKSVSDVW